jgi:hypothetical protein
VTDQSTIYSCQQVVYEIIPEECYRIDSIKINGEHRSIDGGYARVDPLTGSIEIIQRFTRTVTFTPSEDFELEVFFGKIKVVSIRRVQPTGAGWLQSSNGEPILPI